MRRVLPLVLALALTAPPLLAAPPAERPAAQLLFDAGVQLYKRGRLVEAIEAFSASYQADPRAGTMFTLAQTERAHFLVSGDETFRASAVDHYRRYLAEVREGGRRGEAALALAELGTTGVPEAAGPEASQARSPDGARLFVTSATEGARLRIDAGEDTTVPFAGSVMPGRHVVHVVSPGYEPERREVVFVAGATVALDLTLRPSAAKMRVEVEDGAVILVDGSIIGRAPLARDIALSGGSHVVTVAAPGRTTASQTVKLRPGARQVVVMDLETSPRRWVGLSLLGVGGAGAGTGTALALVALGAERSAEELDAATPASPVTPANVASYNDALVRRDELRAAAGVTFAASAVALGVAAYLIFGDEADVAGAASTATTRPDRPFGFVF